ncbi:MAG TPA: peptidoglycan-binding protein [Myxococcota bacterium]|nr:peptidoglycan-binding protein [Myxococcota bacterium]
MPSSAARLVPLPNSTTHRRQAAPPPPARGRGAPDASGPVGHGNYQVKPGDCMESIAYEHGFLAQTLWQLPENADLKRTRNPNVLLPGDRVTIPAPRPREETCATGQRHRFVLRGASIQFRLRFLDDQQQPRSGVAYTLVIDGDTTTGTLDAQGSLTASIRPNASKGSIQLQTAPDPETYPLRFGHLDPDSCVSGAQNRLSNLGFSSASADESQADLAGALLRFQTARGLSPTGQLDAPTRQALAQDHLS